MEFTGKQTTNGAGVFTWSEKGISVNKNILTAGDGYWSIESRNVQINGLCLSYVCKEKNFGELRVYFNTDTWNTMKHGLIYTDEAFLKELRAYLDSLSLVGADVYYSEQGMQGDNFVSFDVCEKFIDSWFKKFGE
jgi:hypothetical protein